MPLLLKCGPLSLSTLKSTKTHHSAVLRSIFTSFSSLFWFYGLRLFLLWFTFISLINVFLSYDKPTKLPAQHQTANRLHKGQANQHNEKCGCVAFLRDLNILLTFIRWSETRLQINANVAQSLLEV